MKTLLIAIMITNSYHLFAQQTGTQVVGTQTPCAAAGVGTAGNFTITYTIGEMPLVETAKSNGLIITQGVMQPLTFIADTSSQCLNKTEVRIYPNPNNGRFSVQLNLLRRGKITILLYDASGRLLQSNAFDYPTFLIRQYDISNMANGNYFLQLLFTPEGKTETQKCVYAIQKMN
jgi:hypothetical protein